MHDLIGWLVLFLVLVGSVALMGWVAFRMVITGGLKGGLTRALSGQAGFVLEHHGKEVVRYRAEATAGRPAVVVREVATTNRKGYTSREWGVEVSGLDDLAARTTLFVGIEGLSGALRNRHTITDVKIGDRGFDRTFKVGGSDADVVRGVFAHDDVRAAVRALFASVSVLGCAVERGSLVVEFQPDHVRGETGRRRIALVLRLAAALGDASASLALKDAARASGSASSSSGAPVGVRIL